MPRTFCFSIFRPDLNQSLKWGVFKDNSSTDLTFPPFLWRGGGGLNTVCKMHVLYTFEETGSGIDPKGRQDSLCNTGLNTVEIMIKILSVSY